MIIFKNEDTGLMRHHPGCFSIKESDYLLIIRGVRKKENNI